jgi:hypothetical protein
METAGRLHVVELNHNDRATQVTFAMLGSRMTDKNALAMLGDRRSAQLPEVLDPSF